MVSWTNLPQFVSEGDHQASSSAQPSIARIVPLGVQLPFAVPA
jgi:hypothetical protein